MWCTPAGANFRTDGEDPLAGAAEIFEPSAAVAENRLRRNRPPLVDVEERLMLRIIREQRGVHREHPQRPFAGEACAHLDRLTLGKRLGRGPRAGAERTAVAQEL